MLVKILNIKYIVHCLPASFSTSHKTRDPSSIIRLFSSNINFLKITLILVLILHRFSLFATSRMLNGCSVVSRWCRPELVLHSYSLVQYEFSVSVNRPNSLLDSFDSPNILIIRSFNVSYFPCSGGLVKMSATKGKVV